MSRLPQLLALFEQDPADADLPYMIGLEHTKAGDFEQAITWLDQAIATNANHFYAYFQKAKAQSQLGDDDDAIATLDTGIGKAQTAGNAKALGELQELRHTLATLND